MSIRILRAGFQSTLQASPRTGHRHSGVPLSGAADPYAQALANRLVGKGRLETVIETSLVGLSFKCESEIAFAVTGADCVIAIGGHAAALHETLTAKAGDLVEIGPATAGCRSYIAFAGNIKSDDFLGSTSTYLPGEFGGHSGLPLKDGDRLAIHGNPSIAATTTPLQYRPHYSGSYILHYVAGPDKSAFDLHGRRFQVGQRCSRMGVQLTSHNVQRQRSDLSIESAPVYPGSIQLPPDGHPFVLLADAQTTGGYPHIGQVLKSDLHQLGQLRPGDTVRFVEKDLAFAVETQLERDRILSEWLSFD